MITSNADSHFRRIGIFYDGNFFMHASNYYRHVHSIGRHISIPRFHDFIRRSVASSEGIHDRFAQIVESRFFRGRCSAGEAEARQSLFRERIFDDILMREGVVTHYLPLRQGREKGIDVWLALEAFDSAIHRRFDVLVLVAGDADFVPLVRRVKSLGTRVMLVGWDLTYVNRFGEEMTLTTSTCLRDEVSYAVMMQELMGDQTPGDRDASLFVDPALSVIPDEASNPPPAMDASPTQEFEGTIVGFGRGFGFIQSEEYSRDVFFHWSSLTNAEFPDLQKSDRVRFSDVQVTEKGDAASSVTVMPRIAT